MFRLLGFIIGSFVSIAALVIMIGVPNFHLDGDSADEDRYEVAIEKLREKQKIATEAIEELPIREMVDAAVPAVTELVEELREETSAEPGIAEPVEHSPPPEQEPAAETVASPTDATPEPAPPAEPGWHEFWTPFRSELAAEGFVRRLESVTGLDYRIVRVKTGVYQVAFSYADDSERSARLSQISAATGLDLSGTPR